MLTVYAAIVNGLCCHGDLSLSVYAEPLSRPMAGPSKCWTELWWTSPRCVPPHLPGVLPPGTVRVAPDALRQDRSVTHRVRPLEDR